MIRTSKVFITGIIYILLIMPPINVYALPQAHTLSMNTKAVLDLIERIAPGHSGSFIIETIEGEKNVEVFELEGRKNKIVLRGTSSLALSKAFNWYLNNYCHTSVSWYKAESIDIPTELPEVKEKIRKTCRFEKRFFLNYCTFGYTMVWWQWQDWERLIDWMALNGINMPLAITGEEYIWQKVWRKFGLTDDEIRTFFTGPAHLPWNRMGNMDGWLGPLPQSYINSQFELQKKILQQERSFGMKPVLPAFAGHTPKAITNKYPNVKLTPMGSMWTGDQYNAYFIDPLEPLFVQIQKEFIKEEIKQFGTDNYYGADPFNEMKPPSTDPAYLASVSRNIYKGLSEVDKDAVWVQMGWTFYFDKKHWSNPGIEALLKGVPKNKMIMLDYFCENVEIWRNTDAFFNTPYIWCYLGNFGGETQMNVSLRKISKLITNAESDPNHRQMVGIGSTLEGFGVNRYMFEWLFDYAWDSTAANIDEWITSYARTRSGRPDAIAENVWQRLTYNEQVNDNGPPNIIQMRPSFREESGDSKKGEYNYRELADIFGEMLLADPKTLASPRYQHDLVIVCKQVLVNLAYPIQRKIYEVYNAKDLNLFNYYTSLFLDLTSDVDKIIATQPEYSFDKWIEASHQFAAPDAPESYFEKNAKVLLTTWGQKDSRLNNYAARDFSGLINSYYKKRWKLFFDTVRKSIEDSTKFNQEQFDKNIAEFEWNFCETPYTPEKVDHYDVSQLAKVLYTKYVSYFTLFNEKVKPGE